MAQYIDKSALVAEIRKRASRVVGDDLYAEVQRGIYSSLEIYINEQDVKEVDLEEEVYEHLWKGRMGTDVSRPIYLSYDELVAVARHFTNWQKGQMIKEAVKGEVGECYPTTIHLEKDVPELKRFDKVKIIIIKDN